MDVSEALRSRYTVRAFKPEPLLDREVVANILKTALRTPSWANTQPWEIYVAAGETLDRLRQAFLDNFRAGVPTEPDIPRPQEWPPELEQRMHELGARRFEALGIDREDSEARQALFERGYRFFGAPVVVYLCMDGTLTNWSIFDIGMLAQSIMLAAWERGVGSAVAYTLVTYPDLIRKELAIPDNHSVIIGIALGYADEDDPHNGFRSPRRSPDETVRLRGF